MGNKILIVDDETEIVIMLKDSLKAEIMMY